MVVEVGILVKYLNMIAKKKEYSDMSFDEEDMFLIIGIQNNNPIYGSYYKKRKKIKKPR